MRFKPRGLTLVGVPSMVALASAAGLAQAVNPCADAPASVFFQTRNAGLVGERFAEMAPLEEGPPPTEIVLPPGQSTIYAGFNSHLGEHGAQGWHINFDTRGTRLVDVTVEGTVAASVTDHPPGLRDEGFVNITFFTNEFPPEFRQGVACSVVLSIKKSVTLPVEGTATVLALTLEGTDGASADLLWLEDLDCCGEVGGGDGGGGKAPFGEDTLTVDGSSLRLCTVSAHVRFDASAVANFRRCDANDDSTHDVSDAIWILDDIFQDRVTRCPAAADCNGDREKDISDPIYLLQFLFQGGPRPPAPFPGCGAADLIEHGADCPPQSTRCG